MSREIGFVNTLSDYKEECKSWRKLVERMAAAVERGMKWDELLPYCNGWNLDYKGRGEGLEEYAARLVDMAIGLQLI